MNIEELAFKDRAELAHLNGIDLLNIIEFLQKDRQQWINQFSKTHNESVEIQAKNKKLNGAIQTYDILLKANVEENKQLKEELECTIGIVEHNRIISKKNKEIHQLKDNWSKLKEWLEKELGDRINPNKDKWLTGVYDAYKETIDKMQELERSDSDGNN